MWATVTVLLPGKSADWCRRDIGKITALLETRTDWNLWCRLLRLCGEKTGGRCRILRVTILRLLLFLIRERVRLAATILIPGNPNRKWCSLMSLSAKGKGTAPCLLVST